MKKIGNILLVISIMMIISGGVSTFIFGLKADREETLKRMEEVQDVFETFSTNTTVFENFRDDLYNEVLGSVYYDTMASTDGIVKNKLSNYENLVDELGRSVNELNKLCENVYYPDGNVNNKCSNYKIIYEQVVNYFVSDINVYNKNVKLFNDYQSKNSSAYLVKEYKTKKVFIDYNNDKNYDGKEE